MSDMFHKPTVLTPFAGAIQPPDTDGEKVFGATHVPGNQILDLNQLLVSHPAGTYFVRMRGNAMRGAGIFDGDILVIDRAIDVCHGQIIMALAGTEYLVRYLRIGASGTFLEAADKALSNIPVTDDDTVTFFGVVTAAIHRFQPF